MNEALAHQPSSYPDGWLRPDSLEQALAATKAGATPLGGGAALASLAFPPSFGTTILDLSGLGLDRIELPRVGAMVTLEELCANAQLAERWPVVYEAATLTATPEVRRVATLGGTVAARLPTSDLLVALSAARAVVLFATPGGGEQRLAVPDYLDNPPEAIILAVELGPSCFGAYRRKAGRPGFAPALASVAGVVGPGGMELWAGAVAARPLPLDERLLPDAEMLRNDGPVSSWYRRELLGVLRSEVVEALQQQSSRRSRVAPGWEAEE